MQRGERLSVVRLVEELQWAASANRVDDLLHMFRFDLNLTTGEVFEYRMADNARQKVPIHLCAENFIIGVEAYGGLGSTEGFAAGEQRHYLAPVVGWHVTPRTTIKASAGFGLTDASDHALLRVGVSFELPGGHR